jgi:hypothetical protein
MHAKCTSRWLVLLLFVQSVFAQHCADESSIKSRLDAQTEKEKADFIKELEKAQFFGSVLRWTAIAGPSMIPTLRVMTRPGMAFNSIPGEAQISLAKLGDETALTELDQELNHGDEGGNAVQKLLYVGNDRAISLLMAFLQAHISDASFTHSWGDYSTDVRSDIVRGLSQVAVEQPPRPQKGKFVNGYEAWLKLWKEGKLKLVPSISADVQDPYLRCLARKVEWGFPQAIMDMANTGNPTVAPVLRTLKTTGIPVMTDLGAGSGAEAQRREEVGLARLGDEEVFQSIRQAANDYGAAHVFDMLYLIGGKKAVDALVEALDSNFPREPHGVWPPPAPSDKRNYASYQRNAAKYKKETDAEILNTLNAMVVDPPHLTGSLESRKKQWQEWWAKNKDTAQFVRPPVTTYE